MFEAFTKLPADQRNKAIANLSKQIIEQSLVSDAVDEVSFPLETASAHHSDISTLRTTPSTIPPGPSNLQFPSPQRDNISGDVILNRVTERLAIRMREELKAEFEAVSRAQKERVGQIDSILAQELQNNTCPICYDIMAPPKGPILLFPCGHTFCSSCLERHSKNHRPAKCPYCRQEIQSQAPNIALQNLIADFLKKKSMMGLRPEDPFPENLSRSGNTLTSPPSRIDPATEGLSGQMKSLEMRCRILANEMELKQHDLCHVRVRRDSTQQQINQLGIALSAAESSLHDAQLRVDRLRQQIAPHTEELSRLSQEEAAEQESLDILGNTLHGLSSEYDRLKLILDHAISE